MLHFKINPQIKVFFSALIIAFVMFTNVQAQALCVMKPNVEKNKTAWAKYCEELVRAEDNENVKESKCHAPKVTFLGSKKAQNLCEKGFGDFCLPNENNLRLIKNNDGVQLREDICAKFRNDSNGKCIEGAPPFCEETSNASNARTRVTEIHKANQQTCRQELIEASTHTDNYYTEKNVGSIADPCAVLQQKYGVSHMQAPQNRNLPSKGSRSVPITEQGHD